MFENDYMDNFYMSPNQGTNLCQEEYNLDIKERTSDKADFQENYFNVFKSGYTTNDEFLENFMKIDYNNAIVFNNKTPRKDNESKGSDSFSTHSSTNNQIQNLNSSNSLEYNNPSTKSGNSHENKIMPFKPEINYEEDAQCFMKQKKGRPMTDTNVIYDEVLDKFFDPDEDPVEYKKARKRLQNRESAIRSRHKKKETSKILENENEYLRMENYRLYHENKSLKTEKSFLIDQIKFMQNLIKSNNLNFKPINSQNSEADIEKNIQVSTSTSSSVHLNGGRQRPLGKFFSVFLVCILSLSYISFDDSSEFNTGEKIVFSSGSTMSLNDASQRQTEIKKTSNFLNNLSTFMTVFICALITWYIVEIYHWVKFYILYLFCNNAKNKKK